MKPTAKKKLMLKVLQFHQVQFALMANEGVVAKLLRAEVRIQCRDVIFRLKSTGLLVDIGVAAFESGAERNPDSLCLFVCLRFNQSKHEFANLSQRGLVNVS